MAQNERITATKEVTKGETKTGRKAWVDSARGFAFLMVIYSHIPMSNENIMNFFAPVFLTTFFFISGYLFKSGEPFSIVLEHRIRTLLLPLITLGFIMIGVSQILTFNESVPLGDAIRGLLLQNGENQILWFIAALFIYSMLFYWIDRLCQTPKMLLIVAVCFFVINSIAYHWMNLRSEYWHLDAFGCACFYMALGRIYRIYETRIDRLIKGWVIAVMALAYCTFIYFSNSYISFFGSYAIIDSMLITLIGLVLILTISKKYFNNSRLMLFVGANTLLYFAFHGKAYSLILAVGQKIAPGVLDNDSLIANVAVALGVVLLDVLILIYPIKAVNRFCPQLIGRKFKIW